MREPYFPLFTSVVRSSLWSQTGDCIKVFLTLCAEADPEGYVSASADGIRRIADLPLEDTLRHLAVLESPEPHSKDTTRDAKCDGRRIVRVANGWRVVNLEWYREEARKQAELSRKRKWWHEKGSAARRDARPTETETETETNTDPEPEKSAPRKTKRGPLWHFVPESWAPAGKVLADTQALLGRKFQTELTKFREWEFRDGKSDPDRAWRRWARTATEPDNAPRGALAPRGGPDRADNGWRPDQRHRTLLERLGRPSAELDRMAGEFIRTGAIGALVGEQADRAFAEFIRGKAGAK